MGRLYRLTILDDGENVQVGPMYSDRGKFLNDFHGNLSNIEHDAETQPVEVQVSDGYGWKPDMWLQSEAQLRH